MSPPPVEQKHRSIVQIIYDENRKKAEEAHKIFEGLGPKVELVSKKFLFSFLVLLLVVVFLGVKWNTICLLWGERVVAR